MDPALRRDDVFSRLYAGILTPAGDRAWMDDLSPGRFA
jgi:hypothetical protein